MQIVPHLSKAADNVPRLSKIPEFPTEVPILISIGHNSVQRYGRENGNVIDYDINDDFSTGHVIGGGPPLVGGSERQFLPRPTPGAWEDRS